MVDAGDYKPEFAPGMRPMVQELFRANDRSPWTASIPKQNTEDGQAASYAQECAFIVRRELDPANQHGSLHSVTVQSPHVRQVLHQTFEDYDGLNTHLKQLVFQAPFHPFFDRWLRFESLCEAEHDAQVKAHLSLLHRILHDEIMPHIETMTDLVENGVISFEYLWTIFARGMHLITIIDDQDQVLEMNECRYGASMSGEYFELDCQYIDGDGLSFGYASYTATISKFVGVKRIVGLEIFPAHLHPNVEQLVGKLYARGEKMGQLNGFYHMTYSGTYTVERSRIIIDPQTFNIHGLSGPSLSKLEIACQPVTSADAQALVYSATRQAFRRYQTALEACATHSKGGSSRQFAVIPSIGTRA
nr:hypothetical protein CFP56_76110 [Quercus suber]